jgi:hypothetical protein
MNRAVPVTLLLCCACDGRQLPRDWAEPRSDSGAASCPLGPPLGGSVVLEAFRTEVTRVFGCTVKEKLAWKTVAATCVNYRITLRARNATSRQLGDLAGLDVALGDNGEIFASVSLSPCCDRGPWRMCGGDSAELELRLEFRERTWSSSDGAPLTVHGLAIDLPCPGLDKDPGGHSYTGAPTGGRAFLELRGHFADGGAWVSPATTAIENRL